MEPRRPRSARGACMMGGGRNNGLASRREPARGGGVGALVEGVRVVYKAVDPDGAGLAPRAR